MMMKSQGDKPPQMRKCQCQALNPQHVCLATYIYLGVSPAQWHLPAQSFTSAKTMRQALMSAYLLMKFKCRMHVYVCVCVQLFIRIYLLQHRSFANFCNFLQFFGTKQIVFASTVASNMRPHTHTQTYAHRQNIIATLFLPYYAE